MIRNSAKKQSKKNKTGIETRTKIEISIKKTRKAKHRNVEEGECPWK